MKLTINKSTEVFIFISLLGLLIAICGVFILPERLFYDTTTILYDYYNEIGWRGSYPLTILFYKITGLKHLPFSVIGTIQFIITIYFTYKIGVPKKFHVLLVKNLIVYLGIVLIGVFLCMPTKEFINYLFICLLVFKLKNEKSNYKIATILILMFLFGLIFRSYYMIIAILSISLFLISKIKMKNKKLGTLFYGLIIAIGISLSYGVVKGEFVSQNTREAFNLTRLNKKANNSMIMSPVRTDTWYGESFGIIYGFFSVNLPLNGLKHIKSPQIIAFVLWQLVLFIILFIRYEKCLKKGIKNNPNIWGFYIIFSFFIVQGMFEPDLGSAMRHKIGFFPLIYYMLYYDSFKKYAS